MVFSVADVYSVTRGARTRVADSSGEGASPVASPSRRLSSGFVYWTPYAAVVVVLRARPNALRFDLAGLAAPRTGSGGSDFGLNPELWTVPLAGRPAAVRGPSRSSRLEQKARGRFSAGGLQWRPRARHLPGSRVSQTSTSHALIHRCFPGVLFTSTRRETTDLEVQLPHKKCCRIWFESL